MEVSSMKIPERCPKLEKCVSKVTKSYFENVCLSKDWVVCPEAESEAEKYEKYPKEWNKLLRT